MTAPQKNWSWFLPHLLNSLYYLFLGHQALLDQHVNEGFHAVHMVKDPPKTLSRWGWLIVPVCCIVIAT